MEMCEEELRCRCCGTKECTESIRGQEKSLLLHDATR